MTLHNAKGLEYDTVFIVGCEEGAFPHMRALEEGGEEEERRLCYVGITRARRRLYMTWARERRLFGRSERNLPSRFVDELPAELTERHGERPGAAGTWDAAASAAAGDPDRRRARPLTADRRRRRPRQLRRRRRHRGRARRHRRRPLRRRRRRAQADGRLRADQEARLVAARVIDGKAVGAEVRERVRAEVAEYVAGSGRVPGLATVIVGEDPASKIYIEMKQRACEEAGMTSVHHGLADRDQRGRAARAGRHPQRRRRRRRDPRPAAAARADRSRPGDRGDRPGQGRRRPDADQRRPARPRHPRLRPGDAGRSDGAAEPRGGGARRGRGGRRRPLEARRGARSRACC